MAMAGQRTIVVDADLRRPTQQEIFEIDPGARALEDILEGRTRLADGIRTTGVKGLHVLVCRGGHPHPAEIVNGPRFAQLVQQLARAYDRVLVDAPPATAVTDAQILSVLCDCTILVLKAGTTTKRIAQRALEGLQGVGARVLGLVVNQVSESDDRSSYYERYRRTRHAGSNGKKDKVREPREIVTTGG